MINTYSMLHYMPEKLRAFKRYIEKYECACFKKGEINTLYFYKETEIALLPYILVLFRPTDKHVIIYVNKELKVLNDSDDVLPENIATNNMKMFLKHIRECAESKNINYDDYRR